MQSRTTVVEMEEEMDSRLVQMEENGRGKMNYRKGLKMAEGRSENGRSENGE